MVAWWWIPISVFSTVTFILLASLCVVASRSYMEFRQQLDEVDRIVPKKKRSKLEVNTIFKSIGWEVDDGERD